MFGSAKASVIKSIKYDGRPKRLNMETITITFMLFHGFFAH